MIILNGPLELTFPPFITRTCNLWVYSHALVVPYGNIKVCWQYLFDGTRISLTAIGMLLQLGYSKIMWLWKEIENNIYFFGIYVLTHAHSHVYEYNYFLYRFFIIFVVIFNKSKIIMSIEQTLRACVRERVILCCAV
jgi:hypothetical protein